MSTHSHAYTHINERASFLRCDLHFGKCTDSPGRVYHFQSMLTLNFHCAKGRQNDPRAPLSWVRERETGREMSDRMKPRVRLELLLQQTVRFEEPLI